MAFKNHLILMADYNRVMNGRLITPLLSQMGLDIGITDLIAQIPNL